MRVPELAGDTEPVELPSALAQAVEVLLAGELEGGAETAARVAHRFREHSAVRGFSQQPRSRRVEEGEAHRSRRRLDLEIGGGQTYALALEDLEGRAGPAPRTDVRGTGHVPFIGQLDADDARGAHGDRHRCAVMVKPDGRSAALES